LDLPDPRLQQGGTTYLPSLKRWLVSLHKADPASTRVYPCNASILRQAYLLSANSTATVQTRYLATVGYFFMCRPGEVVLGRKDSRTTPFRLCDVELTVPPNRLVTFTNNQAYGQTLNDVYYLKATRVSLIYTDQKNCVKGEKISHSPSGHPLLCPVLAVAHIVCHLLRHSAPPDTPLYTYYLNPTTPKSVTSSMVTKLLRGAATKIQHLTGIPPDKISARSLRPGGATALLCAGHLPTNIALIGRWRSEAMLRYLRAQATPAAASFAQQMVDCGDYTYQLATDPADEDFFGLPSQARRLPPGYQRFDPTDDASDDDEPDFASPSSS
jgi:hypothetical protein